MDQHYIGISLCNVGLDRSRQHRRFFCAKLFVEYGPTLYKQFSCAMLAQADQENIAYGYFPTKR